MLDLLRNLAKSAEEKEREALHAYLDDELSARQKQRFEQRLSREPELQERARQARLLKSQLRQLPQRRVPRNFTLDPALYGRPARQPLFQIYPVMRVATVMTAFFFIFAIAAELFLPQAASAPGATVAQETALVTDEAAEEAAVAEVEVVTEAESLEVEPVGEAVVTEIRPAEVAEEAEQAFEEVLEEEPAAEEMAAEEEIAAASEPEEDATLGLSGTRVESLASPDGKGEGAASTLAATPSLDATNSTASDAAPLPAPSPTRSILPRSTPVPDVDRAATAADDVAESPAGEDSFAAEIAPTSAPALQEHAPVEDKEPLSVLQIVQIVFGVAFLILALATMLIRRQL